MTNIVFRADGSSQIGMGHVMRCLAMRQMLPEGINVRFAVYQPDLALEQLLQQSGVAIHQLDSQKSLDFANGFDTAVIDGYWFDADYVKELKRSVRRVVQIDDLCGEHFYSDIVINHAMGVDYSKSQFHNRCKLLTGSSYALLRKEFLLRSKRVVEYQVPKRVTINMGGADPLNLTAKLLEALVNTQYSIEHINVLIGGAYKSRNTLERLIETTSRVKVKLYESLDAAGIVNLFEQTDLLLCASSTIVYEAAAISVPIGCFLTADNQSNMYKGLVEGQYVMGLGDLRRLDNEQLRTDIESVLHNFSEVSKRVLLQKQLIDGKSGERIREELLGLWS